ncbi:MAG: holo-ACP synthase [Deltaproteobacteria bacterium]|nr:holo-ACP synthase [Deltaproteobacteria bacterium]
MIHGTGIDVVDISRFKKALERWGDRMKERLFTEEELRYCLRQKFPERHLAARFAAKESVFKALGMALPFKDVEIIREAGGRPSVRVKGIGKDLRLSVSLSHDGSLGAAQAIVERT